MNKIFSHYNKGFTMVETLVAVAILMISIAGPLTIANKGLTAAVYAKDQVVASFLAQDAMEYIKNKRDNNILSNNDWLLGLDSCSWGDICTIDTTDGDIENISATSCSGNTCRLYDNEEAYTMSNTPPGVKTKFNRSFYIDNFIPGVEATVIVNVEWANGTIANKVSLQGEIFNISR